MCNLFLTPPPPVSEQNLEKTVDNLKRSMSHIRKEVSGLEILFFCTCEYFSSCFMSDVAIAGLLCRISLTVVGAPRNC